MCVHVCIYIYTYSVDVSVCVCAYSALRLHNTTLHCTTLPKTYYTTATTATTSTIKPGYNYNYHYKQLLQLHTTTTSTTQDYAAPRFTTLRFTTKKKNKNYGPKTLD